MNLYPDENIPDIFKALPKGYSMIETIGDASGLVVLQQAHGVCLRHTLGSGTIEEDWTGEDHKHTNLAGPLLLD
jgi:hypothetical protein